MFIVLLPSKILGHDIIRCYAVECRAKYDLDAAPGAWPLSTNRRPHVPVNETTSTTASRLLAGDSA